MKRKILKKIIAWKSQVNRKPLILNGVRQVGKTFLLKQFATEYFPAYHYFDFEKERDLAKIFQPNLNPVRIIDELSFYSNKTIDINNDLIIFDEIQACPDALTSLKYFCEDMPELALCSAGSLLGIHLNSGSYPVGKVDVLTMRPLSFMEFLEALHDDKSLNYLNDIDTDTALPEIVHKHLWQQLKHYFIVGGLPEIVDYYCNAISDNDIDTYSILQNVRTKQDALIKAYFADMAKHSGKVNAMHLNRIWYSVASQLTQVQDDSAPKFRFKNVVPGIDRYSRLAGAIDWLEHVGLIIKINIVQKIDLPLSAYAKEGTFKLLMFDVGILGAMSNLSPTTILNYDYGTYKGYFAENFVAQEFLNIGVQQLFSWQGRLAEIEYLREINDQIIPVEVKSGNLTRAKSLQAYIQKYQPEYAVILSAKNLYHDAARKVYYYPLYLASQIPINADDTPIRTYTD